MKLFTAAVVTSMLMIVSTLTVSNGAIYSGINENTLDEMISPIHSKCPPNVTADFEVIFNGEDSSTAKGCASLVFKSRNDSNEMKIFGLMFGRLNSDGSRVCVPGNYAGMEQLMFSCKSQPDSSTLESDSTNVFRLIGHVVKPVGKHQARCILYKMTNSVMNMMVISETISCRGLSLMLFSPHAKSPKGSTLLRLNTPKDDLRHRRSTSEDKNSTQLDFSGSRFFWRAG